MIEMKDSVIEPGDIVFVISHKNDVLTRLKRSVQAITTAGNKHGHREVLSVFVCVAKNKFGIIGHNHEGYLVTSEKKMRERLQEQSVEELISQFLNFCDKSLSVAEIKTALEAQQGWLGQFANQIKTDESIEKLRNDLLEQIRNHENDLVDILLCFWKQSGMSMALNRVNSSLLVFKFTDRRQRQQFLEVYKQQVAVTAQFKSQKKSRFNWWALFSSLFKKAGQDKKDVDQRQSPSDLTYCSRNVIQVLNNVDPKLVARGRHITPKTLEAGMRAATKMKQVEVNEQDDFESTVKRAEQLLPPFRMNILPCSGKELIKQLLEVADKEYKRISNKRHLTNLDKIKLDGIKDCLLPYRDTKYQNYPINLQVNVALELLACLLPILKKKKSGLFENWFPARSYDNLRTFARQQGIFDGDIREVIPQLISDPVKDSPVQIIIFSDWSLINWSTQKRERIIAHMVQLLADGHQLYLWKKGELIEMNDAAMREAFNLDNFANRLAMEITPEINSKIMEKAKRQGLDTAKIQHLDYQQCNIISKDKLSIADCIDKAALLFSAQLDRHHLRQTKLAIIDNELLNTADNQVEQAALTELREKIAAMDDPQPGRFRTGIDTTAKLRRQRQAKPIFQPLGLRTSMPPINYYRREVYTQLVVNQKPCSHFQYFELQGMKPESLQASEYLFHKNGLNKSLKRQRLSASSQAIFEGKYTLSLDGHWQAIPSLHPEEMLTDIAISGIKASDFEIQYSDSNHLYYIRQTHSSKPKQVELNYLLQMPKQYRTRPIYDTISPMPKYQDIHDLLIKYLHFGKDMGKLSAMVGNNIQNGQQYLTQAQKLGVGSCRLRAIAFKDEMMRLHPEIPVNISVNAIHCFIEMKLEGSWQRYCLGGYSNTPAYAEFLNNISSTSCAHSFFKSKKHSNERHQTLMSCGP